MLPFLRTFFLLKSLLLLMRQPYQSPHILPFSIFVQHPGHRFFAVKHQQQVVLLAVKPAVLGSPLPAPCRGGWPALFHTTAPG